ncbi:hypothetical protein L7F22_021587 [Adiantum nelumboides]|nr:hypothetical protein [Adiantum nelumboides]
MDSYSEDLRLQNKGFVTDLSTNELPSMERNHEVAQPQFGVDEPLEVQLRFELGSLVDTHVLIDTDEPRESHWDFVRQEQGRFQASSEENNAILSHGKQDDLKSFDNCESWPGSASQVDAHLFMDGQDDVSMITEAFGGKAKGMTDLVEDDRGLLLPSTYRQCEEGTAWIGEVKEVLEVKALNSCREDVVDGDVEASQILDASLAGKSSLELRESYQSQVELHPTYDAVKEPLPSTEPSCEVLTASPSGCKPQCTVLAVSFEEANQNQELFQECSTKDLVDCTQPKLSTIDDAKVSEKTQRVDLAEDINPSPKGVQVAYVPEEEPNITGSKVEVELKVRDKMITRVSDSAEMKNDSDLISRTSLAQETRELSAEPEIDTCVTLHTGESFIAPADSHLDKTRGGSCLESDCTLADAVEKRNVSNRHSAELESNLQDAEGIGINCASLSKSFQETTVLSILEASTTADNGVEKITGSHGELEKPHEAVPAEVLGATSMPGTRVLEQGDSYDSGAGKIENNSSVNSLEQSEVMLDIASAAVLSAEGTHEDNSREQLPATETPQMSEGLVDLEDTGKIMVPHKQAVEGVLDPTPKGILSNADCSSKELLENMVEAQGASDGFKQEQVETDGNESVLQEHTAEENATDSSLSFANPSLSNESKVSTEGSHPGGILHVLIDVQKEGLGYDSPNVPVQEHEDHEGLADVQTSDISNITGGAKVAEQHSDAYVSDSALLVAASCTQMDSCPSQEKSGKRKSDSSTRNSRLKDSARASPLQVLSDQERKNLGLEGLGRRKATPKSTGQKKGTEPIEGFASPKKSTSKSTLARKKNLSPMAQNADCSAAVKEGSQTPASIAKNVYPRQHASSELNGLETPVPMVSPFQPFSEPQQVQLRAQILVYGSLIQGAAPEEALMVAAFSNVTGGQVVKDTEASERAVWEKQWQAAVDRIHAKKSHDILKDSSRANLAVVPNSLTTTVKAAEGVLKPNDSSGFANSTIDGRGATGLPTRASEASGTKTQASRAKSTDPAHDLSVSKGSQPIVAPVPPGSVTSTASHSVSSSLNESNIQPVKARSDSQQLSPAYLPTPPLGPFLTGVPQWFPAAPFTGSWIPQTQAAVYSNPPALLTHAQPVVSPDIITSETRRSIPSSSETVMPISSFGTTFFTPVVGGLSVTPTPIADPSQNKQPVSEPRPRKRKKTHCESYGPSTDVNSSYFTGPTPGVGALVTTSTQLGQACLGISSTGYLSPPAPEALALVVANTQLSKTSQESSLVAVHANKVSAPSFTNMPTVGLPSTGNFLENSVSLQHSTNNLAQAQASAEEAASTAASALKESESLWSQLKTQKGAGLIPEIESKLVSSAIAMATAASVAKAAAAAAKAAYQAAIEAKRMSESLLEVGKQASEYAVSSLPEKKAEIASHAWGMPKSCNSILAAAKIASKQRLDSVCAARVKAENFESIVRAAELATTAITQVGSVMAMGESVPFTLDMLLEAGPEGLHRLEDKIKTKPKSTALRSPRRTGTPKSIERVKRIPLKTSSGKDVASQKDGQLDNWTSDSIMAVRPENDEGINTELEVGLMKDFSKQKATDHLALSMPASRQGLLTTRTEGGVELEALAADNKIVKGSLVEVMSDEKGLCGVWFSARVQSVDDEKVFVLYDDLLADDGYSPLEEWIQLKGSSGKAPRVRTSHPNANVGFEGTRKRRREAMRSHKWSVGDRVDAWIRDGWWEGEIKEIIEDGESKAKVFFPGDGDTSIVKTSKLRPSLVWNSGHWVLWSDTKQGKKDSSRAKTDLHEGDTPLAKRQKSDKIQASDAIRQKRPPGNAGDASVAQKDGSLFDSSTANLRTDFKGFTVEGVAKPKQQGSKVIFGVPRPTKKRKLIEVSKHFGSAGGVTSTSAFDAKPANNRIEGALVYAPGSSDTSRLDASKAKKRALHLPKVRPQKDANSEVKAIGIRNKREKIVVATKTLVRKNTSNKEGLLSASKTKEGKVMKKKNLPSSNNNQLESQEKSEDRALPSNVTIVETPTPIAGEDIGKETPLATESKEKPNDISGREPFHAVQETDGTHVLPKGKEKQSLQQTKDSEVQSLAPFSANESTSQSTKKKETFKNNEEVAHKRSESQPNHEDEKKLEVSSKKQPANSVNNDEKQTSHSNKETEKSKEVAKPASETWEPRRTSRKIQPTSKLLEGLQTAPKLGKHSSLHDRGTRGGSKAPPQP